jgi:hypothetical protein
LVYFIVKEINKNCELSCDESIIAALDTDGRRQYGNTLLASVSVNGTYINKIAPLTLNEDAKLIKERLGAIMTFEKKSKLVVVLTIVLTVSICFGGTFIGAYAASPSTEQSEIEKEAFQKSDDAIMETATIGKLKFYLIENENDLRAIGNGIYSLSDNYMLNGDITLTQNWIPIGNDITPFTGIFEGNGYKINNLVITDKNAKYIGLFGYVDISDAGGYGRAIAPIVAIALDSDVSDCKIE